jgi:hypothetical protein
MLSVQVTFCFATTLALMTAIYGTGHGTQAPYCGDLHHENICLLCVDECASVYVCTHATVPSCALPLLPTHTLQADVK